MNETQKRNPERIRRNSAEPITSENPELEALVRGIIGRVADK